MKHDWKKWLSLLLCAGLMLAALPAMTLADVGEADGDGDAGLTEPEATEAPKGDVYNGTDLNLGVNSYSITAGDTTYRRFTFPDDGTYRFYSISNLDTRGFMRNGSNVLGATDDDSGQDKNFLFRVKGTAGTAIYLGVALYNASASGTVNVVAERMTRVDKPMVLGRNEIVVQTAGDYVYRTFTPEVTGVYSVYSYSAWDTFGMATTEGNEIVVWDDDSGASRNFSFSCLLEAGKTYYIGARYYSGTATGTIPVIIERRVANGNALALGRCDYEITTAETTVYRPFTPSVSGNYRFYSAPRYESALLYDDTEGMLADSDMAVFEYDDDGGYASNFATSGNLSLYAGDTYYFGARYYDADQTGTIRTIIERPVYGGTPLSLGENSIAIDTAGSTVYRPFTPTESGRYEIYSTGSADTFGTFADSGYRVAFYDDDSGSDRNFGYSIEMDAGETYFIGVRYYQYTETGNIPVVIKKTASMFEGTVEWNKSDLQYKGNTPYRIYNGAAHTPRFTVKDKNGSVVDPVNYTYEYRENVNAGTAYVIVTFRNAYAGTARAWFKIYLPATTAMSVENVENGIYMQWNAVEGAAGYVIYRRAWSSTTNGWTSFERWNNTPDLNWTDTTVYAGSRYQYGVKAYFARRTDPVSGAQIGGNVGDNYNLGEVGPLKTTVRITTRRLKSLKAGSKQITASWEGSSKFTGYEVQSATNAAFTQDAKTTKIGNPKTYSTTLKSLKNGTEYYVRVRSYHVFEGMTYYGRWSNVLSVKPGSGQTVSYVGDPTYRALLVGESDYSAAQASDRASGVYDANAMAGVLEGLTNRFDTRVLTNAGKNQIINAIRSAYTDTNDNSVSVFFFSGHGASDVYGRGGLYVTDDQTLTYKELAAELNTNVKGRVIVILSCCYSGSSINKSAEDDPTREIIEAFAGFSLDPEAGAKTGDLANSKFLVIAGAHSSEVGWSENHIGFDGNGCPQSALAAAVVMGMGCKYPNGAYKGSGMPADTSGDSAITLKELYTYAYDKVYGWTDGVSSGGYSGPQHVQYYGPDDAILFKR